MEIGLVRLRADPAYPIVVGVAVGVGNGAVEFGAEEAEAELAAFFHGLTEENAESGEGDGGGDFVASFCALGGGLEAGAVPGVVEVAVVAGLVVVDAALAVDFDAPVLRKLFVFREEDFDAIFAVEGVFAGPFFGVYDVGIGDVEGELEHVVRRVDLHFGAGRGFVGPGIGEVGDGLARVGGTHSA